MIFNVLKDKILKCSVLSLSLGGFLLYVGILNRYHLAYLEKSQLFRYNLDYLMAFLQEPGGFLTVSGAFLTQFFYFPWIGALILTLMGFAIVLSSRSVFRKTGINGTLVSLMPLFLLAALHSHHHFPLSYSLGWLLSLLIFTALLRIQQEKIRRWTIVTVFVITYYLTGFFSFMLLLLSILYELLYSKTRTRFVFTGLALSIALLIPYISWKVVYLMPPDQMWISPVSLSLMAPVKLFFYAMVLYYPLLILIFHGTWKISGKAVPAFTWTWRYVVPGAMVYLMALLMLFKLAYDRNNELFLAIYDHYQTSSWKKMLTLSRQYPGNNQLILYFTNMALYKSGEMANRMFAYKQAGTSGLWLEWKRNETAPFFGGEIFYQLGYNNEAFRWAFEAMEAKGLNPVSLKRLIVTSIINRDYALADKYLNYFDQTLLYRKWARTHRTILDDTTKLANHPELFERRNLLVRHDFITDLQTTDIGLRQLLENQPKNRMAFEYLMASCLLNRDLAGFAAQIARLSDLGYPALPVHYEEALLLYNGLNKKNYTPDGYAISQATRDRFHHYATVFAAHRHSPERASQALQKDFGQTFWYYMQFAGTNPSTPNQQ